MLNQPICTRLLWTGLIFFIVTSSASAQTKITFQVDMRPQMKDSTFVPSEGSVEMSGNQLPFSNIRTITLKDKAPVDSIYVTTINFPSLTNGKILKYNFIIKNKYDKIEERQPRLLQLQRQKNTLSVTTFNGFIQ